MKMMPMPTQHNPPTCNTSSAGAETPPKLWSAPSSNLHHDSNTSIRDDGWKSIPKPQLPSSGGHKRQYTSELVVGWRSVSDLVIEKKVEFSKTVKIKTVQYRGKITEEEKRVYWYNVRSSGHFCIMPVDLCEYISL